MINENEYPTLVSMMAKCLYQDAAPSFKDAIEVWHLCGNKSMQSVLKELDAILAKDYSEQELAEFTFKFSDYIEGTSAKETLVYIKNVLFDKMHKME